jgi:peptide/nickel transport system ATP-binding protein
MAAPDLVLEAREVVRTFGTGAASLVAVDRVTLGVAAGEAVGIVGESGSGKSTLARMLVGLSAPDSGLVALDGEPVDARRRVDRRRLLTRVQFVFQDPASAFNPRRTVGQALEAPLIGLTTLGASERRDRVADLLTMVGLRPDHAARHPHAFSGGQLQRVGIARALAAEPAILVLDEPVSALDVSVQAQVLALLRRLRTDANIAMVFVSHDLAVVESLCDRIAVMRRGRVVEEGACRAVLAAPREDYTRSLIAAARFEAA